MICFYLLLIDIDFLVKVYIINLVASACYVLHLERIENLPE